MVMTLMKTIDHILFKCPALIRIKEITKGTQNQKQNLKAEQNKMQQ